MRNCKLLIVSAIVLGSIYATSVEGSSWPMFRHDPRHTGCTPYTGPATPAIKWTFAAKEGIASSPTIGVDGTIYIGAGWTRSGPDSSLYAINPDGSLKWRFATQGGVFSSAAIGPDGTIYFGSLDNSLYALEDHGSYAHLKWATPLVFWIYSSPVIGADGTIYVGCLDFHLYAIDPGGSIKWKYGTDWCVFSSPAIGSEGEIYFGSKDERLFAMEDSVTYGKLRWSYAAGTFYDGHLVDSSPAIGSDGTIYVGTDPYGAAGQTPVPVDTVFFAINPDGSLKWKFVMEDGVESSPTIGPDGTVYVGSYDGNLYAIRDAGDEGVLEWTFPTGGWVDGSPTVDGCGTIYVGSRDSTLYAINPDGTLRWSFLTGDGIESSATIDDNGILYIGSFDGNLYALGTDGPDVGVDSVDIQTEVIAGYDYTPKAKVRNYRSGSQSFSVSCLIDTAGYHLFGDTLFVNDLAETTSAYLSFDPWTVCPDTGIVYNVSVIAMHGSDGNWYNDTLTVQTRSVADPYTDTGDEEIDANRRFSLEQCYPNPFNATTTISFTLNDRSRIRISVYNVTGELVKTLLDEVREAGTYNDVIWDGKSNSGRNVSSGLYFYRLEADSFADIKKMVLLR